MEESTERKKSLVFAYYVTGHGFGHATRVVEVARQLILGGNEVHIVTGAPEFIFRKEIDSPKLFIRKVLLDSGAVQSDALTVDRLASLELYAKTAVLPRATLLPAEAQWLRSIKADLVVSDVVPIACKAATDAGIPSVCVSNFSWDFIYSEYMPVAAPHHRSIVWQIAEDYSNALFVIRLPGHCPMPAFRDVVDAPLVVRALKRNRQEVREEFGISEEEKILLFNFGGQDSGWALKDEFLPQGWKCLVCGAPEEQELSSSFIRMKRDVYTPDLIAASDCMLGKIGYGTVSEVLAYRVPFVFIRRDYFSEEPFLRKRLDFYRTGVEMPRRDFFSGRWVPYLQRAQALKPRFTGDINGGQVVAQILEQAAEGKTATDAALKRSSGSRRLQDAIIFGFQMQRHPSRELELPDWYTSELSELEVVSSEHSPASPTPLAEELAGVGHDFEILHGSVRGLPDTSKFLRTLAKLDEEGDVLASDLAHKPFAQEQLAAAGLFRWDDDVFVARAPGRLDVMGGIADYSGSLVLQMPIREACHVAVQCQPQGKQRLWKHMMARQQPGVFKPAVRIVSFGSDLSNRAPTFDMDLSDFMDAEGKPISYEAARKYFEQDPSRKWAAYVAGTILVLIRERGVQFCDGLSILVSSAVPEGKGVSSSAALEVATMSAITAALGIELPPEKMAILCQMVENYVVGAPCGIMDQMAAACGQANRLLAMICQPAVVLEHIDIPLHVRFWGLDSGIRHSVGGSDYGSVRVGTFMGRRIIQSEAARYISETSLTPADENQRSSVSLEDFYQSQLRVFEQEVNLDYLCNIPPSRYDAVYVSRMPEEMLGQAFVDKYGSHNDPVTKIELDNLYKIRAPTSHPVYENSRVKTFAALLTGANTEEQLGALGELMYQTHTGYSNCGLGTRGTDLLVTLTRYMQQSSTRVNHVNQGALYGAKISGGGCGGTVCLVGRDTREAHEQVSRIQLLYTTLTGHKPYLFEGSSPGAAQFGYLKLRRLGQHH